MRHPGDDNYAANLQRLPFLERGARRRRARAWPMPQVSAELWRLGNDPRHWLVRWTSDQERDHSAL